MLDKNAIESIIENPDKITTPWYGQLMTTPQTIAYMIMLNYWMKKFSVQIV